MTRRRALRGMGGIAAGTLSFVTGDALATNQQAPGPVRTIAIRSTGENKVAVYKFQVSGTLRTTDDSSRDAVDGRTAFGRVGPLRGTDSFEYTGDITAFELAGPAVVTIDDAVVITEWSFPRFADRVTAADCRQAMDRSRDDTERHTIRFTNPRRITAYQLAVTGRLFPTADTRGDLSRAASATSVTSHLGPTRGTDTYEFTGDVSDFTLVGICDVYVDGTRVQAGSAPPTPDPGTDGHQLMLVNGGTRRATYRALVSGDVEHREAEAGDSISQTSEGTLVTGDLAPMGAQDEIWFTGELLGLSWDGEVAAYIDREPIEEGDVPAA